MADHILCYAVFDRAQNMWLSEDEKSWSDDFQDAAAISSWELADDIMKREGGDFVFAVMGSR